MTNRPNILLIMSDQHRYDCVGRANDYPVETPNIDKLASQGMWFEHAYTPIPLCCPTRQAFLAGKRPEALGCHWNYDQNIKIPPLDPGEYSWPRDLKQAGYRSAYIGKWHVNPEHGPTEYGYDEHIGERLYGAYRNKLFPDVKYKDPFMGEPDPIPLEHSRTHWQSDRAIELIERYTEAGSPWHIRLEFTEPHLPCRPAGRFATMYDPDRIPKWRSFDDDFEGKPYVQKQQLYNWGIEDYTWEDWAPIVARYYGIISQLDDAIGRVLDKLDQLGIADNTIVIYISDHGDMCGGHRMMDKHYIMYDDVVRVPLVIRWPGIVEPGSVCSEFVYNSLDLPPTILDLLGLDPTKIVHGRSFLQLLKGQQVSDWRNCVVSTYNGQQFGLYTQRMLRTREWKYVWNTTDVDELYDLRNDPDELVNRIHDPLCADVVAELRRRLFYELKAIDDGFVKNPWMQRQLLNNRKL